MPSPIISVENLGKSYLVGHESTAGQKYTALRDVLGNQVRNFVRKSFDMLKGRQIVQGDTVEEFWALRNINFEVREGEVLGIVGHNGAGKSTLLKILSRITDPTEGRVTLRGRVASLLEVGTGFHPELTGRENIFLNGSILGMKRAEINREFDKIVEFAEVERFLDTPVKRYSSGMYVRLAFAVAAHLDPEILVVDEVLAVGDSQFQRKCLGKMQDVSREQGRTVLFVSHNMSAIKSLCSRAICLERGMIVSDGTPDTVLQRYLHAADGCEFDGEIPIARPRQYGTGELQFRSVKILSDRNEPVRALTTGNTLDFSIRLTVKSRVENLCIEVGILEADGRQLTQSRWPRHAAHGLNFDPGDYEIQLSSTLIIFPGRYSILLAAHRMDGTTLDWVERALDFEVLNAGSDSPLHQPWEVRGFFQPQDQWRISSNEVSSKC